MERSNAERLMGRREVGSWRFYATPPRRRASWRTSWESAETRCTSTSGFFGEPGWLINPPAHGVVFCVDVKPQIQALDRTAPMLPLSPG